jgi:HD-GYP domain-containing protein (c-di-GMP phosphodiesterase class II)
MSRLGIDTEPDISPPVQRLLEDFSDSIALAPGRREAIVEGVDTVLFLAVATLLALLAPSDPDLDAATAVLLVAAFAVAKRAKFNAGVGFALPTQLVFVPMLFLLPPGAVPFAVLAGSLLGALPDVVRRRNHPASLVLVPGDCWYAVGPAVVFAVAGVPDPDWSAVPLFIVALAAQFAVDFAATSLREWIGLGVSPKLQLRLFGWVALVDVMLSPIGLLAVFADPSATYAFLLVLPLIGLLQLFAGERRARIENAVELGRAYRGTTLLLADVLQVDHEYTAMHSRGVVSLGVRVAGALQLDERRVRNVEFAALLHDVGKIAIPNEVLNKPGPLSDEEWTVVRTHTVEGQRMLERVGGLLGDIGRIVRSCHERWDGGGYPDGIAGEEIPLEARVVFCCDAFDAMTSDRPYRPAMPLRAAVAELEANAGTQFDPRVVEALIGIVGRDAPVVAQAQAPATSSFSSAGA